MYSICAYIHVHGGHKHTQSLEWQCCQGCAKNGEDFEVCYTYTYIHLSHMYIFAVVYTAVVYITT